LILVLWCCHHGGSAGRHTDLEDVRTTADQQGGIQILKMCGLGAAQRSYYWCGSGAYYWRCYAALIGAATQLFWRCYAALIGAATQLLLALLRSYFGAATQLFWRCYHGRISRGGSEKGKGCGLGARAARSTRRKTQKNANEMCLCFQSSRL
jgi:hypothetical protein